MNEIQQSIEVDSGHIVHRNQLVVCDRNGFSDKYVVTEIVDGEITLVDPNFENQPTTVPADEFTDRGYIAQYVFTGVPIWGY